jgi:hypothetical protein
MRRAKENDGKRKKTTKIRGVDVERGESVVLVARPSLAAVWPKYLLTLGLYGLWRRQDLSVLTDRRVLVGKGIFSRTENSIPIARISDANYLRKGIAGYVEIASTLRGRTNIRRVGPLSARQARRFTAEILSRS